MGAQLHQIKAAQRRSGRAQRVHISRALTWSIMSLVGRFLNSLPKSCCRRGSSQDSEFREGPDGGPAGL